MRTTSTPTEQILERFSSPEILELTNSLIEDYHQTISDSDRAASDNDDYLEQAKYITIPIFKYINSKLMELFYHNVLEEYMSEELNGDSIDERFVIAMLSLKDYDFDKVRMLFMTDLTGCLFIVREV